MNEGAVGNFTQNWLNLPRQRPLSDRRRRSHQ